MLRGLTVFSTATAVAVGATAASLSKDTMLELLRATPQTVARVKQRGAEGLHLDCMQGMLMRAVLLRVFIVYRGCW